VDAAVFGLCWCRKAEGVTDCRHPDDFLISVGDVEISGPLLQQQFSCRSGEPCFVGLSWPDGVIPSEGWLSVASGRSCGEPGVERPPGFPGGPAYGVESYEWPLVLAHGSAARALCWCSSASPADIDGAEGQNCTEPEEYSLQVGSMEISGPFPHHSFLCDARLACEAAPLRGFGLSNGFSLLFTSRDSCVADELGEPGNYTDVQDVVAEPALLSSTISTVVPCGGRGR